MKTDVKEKYEKFDRDELLQYILYCEEFLDDNLVEDGRHSERLSVYGRLSEYAYQKNNELAALTARVKELEEALNGWKGVMYSIPLVNIGAGDAAKGIRLVEKTAAALRNKTNEYIFGEEVES